ncbi:MAG: hypothetical protein WBX25_24295 [Rhodomicrobium sp.]
MYELEAKARHAKVGVIQTAIASGVLQASEFYHWLSQAFSFAGNNLPYRVHLPTAPEDAWLLMDRPVPLTAAGATVVALNGQTSSVHTLLALSRKLGAKRRHLKLITRQELIDSVTRSHGQALVRRAADGLRFEWPSFSAKIGLASWQAYFGAVIAGLSLGSLAIAPAEALTVLGAALSLVFLLAIGLRFAAVVNLMFPQKEIEKAKLLSDGELPHYTVFVPLFKEVEILPYLAKAAWIKQRTRWLKGWMQTFGVHMRAPFSTLRETGLAGFLAFHAYFAGVIVSSLAHPLFYVVLLAHRYSGSLFKEGDTPYNKMLFGLAVVNFVGGYAVNVLLGAASVLSARRKGLLPYVIFIPVYWLYISAAAYRAVWQLIRNPFYWEKTEHGVSRTLREGT